MKNRHYITVICLSCLLLSACGGGSASDAGASQQQTSAESVNLHWDIPTTRVDGSALSISELGGYRIYSSTDGDSFSRLVEISNSATTQHTITDLSAGTYYYYITAIDSAGNESPLSNMVHKSIL